MKDPRNQRGAPKQLVILSGKGGSGKTCLAAAFAHLAFHSLNPRNLVFADADVDAANLELVLRSHQVEAHDFTGGSVARINPALCQKCGICEQVCRFDAVVSEPAGFWVDPVACDGCAACVYQCPEMAIHMEPQIAGRWYRSESRFGTLFHADLFPAQENSGKLVTIVKQNARLCALDSDAPLVIVDGPPGIGCPVIAAATGADLALIVTEPTLSGIHDLSRIIQLIRHFRLPGLVVINKADIYLEGSSQIEALCDQQGIELVGRIPFDPLVTEAMLNGEPVTDFQSAAPSSRALESVWEAVYQRLFSP